MEIEKEDIIDCVIDDLGMYGEGITHVGGQTVFIPGALIGEKVTARVVLAKPTFAHAVLEKRLSTSPFRVSPPCPYFKQCGGCSIQHLSYGGQLELKRNMVSNALKKYAGIEFEVEEVAPSEKEYGYRNKVTLPVASDGKEGAVMGLYMKKSHRIVPIADCLLQKPPTFSAAKEALKFALEEGLEAYNPSNGVGDLRYISVRSLGKETAVTFVVKKEKKDWERRLKAAAEKFAKQDFSVFVNYNSRRDNVILGDNSRLVYGNAETEVSGFAVETHPQAFFQVNDGIRDELYREAAAQIAEGEYVVDAYCGAGIMSAVVSRKADKVVGVEISRAAVDSALRLKERNGIENLSFLCGDCSIFVEKALDNAPKNAALILDPPKSGCEKEVLRAAEKAAKIIYIGCNPATLARDTALLVSAGFRLIKVRPFDMFPQTSSVETLAVFRK